MRVFWNIDEKTSKSIFINIGVYIFPSDFLQILLDIIRKMRKKEKLTNALYLLAKKEEIFAIEFTEEWFHLAYPEDIEKAEHDLKK